VYLHPAGYSNWWPERLVPRASYFHQKLIGTGGNRQRHAWSVNLGNLMAIEANQKKSPPGIHGRGASTTGISAYFHENDWSGAGSGTDQQDRQIWPRRRLTSLHHIDNRSGQAQHRYRPETSSDIRFLGENAAEETTKERYSCEPRHQSWGPLPDDMTYEHRECGSEHYPFCRHTHLPGASW